MLVYQAGNTNRFSRCSKVPRATSNPSTWTVRAAAPVACGACGARRLESEADHVRKRFTWPTCVEDHLGWFCRKWISETAIFDDDLWISERFNTKSFRIEPVSPKWGFDQQKLGKQFSIVHCQSWALICPQSPLMIFGSTAVLWLCRKPPPPSLQWKSPSHSVPAEEQLVLPQGDGDSPTGMAPKLTIWLWLTVRHGKIHHSI